MLGQPLRPNRLYINFRGAFIVKSVNPMALFRLSVLGRLISCEQLQRGELQCEIRALAQRQYTIPESDRHHLSEKTIQAWY